MTHYYVCPSLDPVGGLYEVHCEGCAFLPSSGNRLYLGPFFHWRLAIKEAWKYHHQVNACRFCCSGLSRQISS